MGSGASKPDANAPSHVFTSETPVRFSSGLVDSLEKSTESNSTRADAIELHVQARVAEELKRLQKEQESTLSTLLNTDDAPAQEQQPLSADNDEAAGSALRQLGRESVSREVAALKAKLEKRKQVKGIAELDAEVDAARSEVIKCLKGHESKPLECVEEVERFKRGVARLEKSWVESVVN